MTVWVSRKGVRHVEFGPLPDEDHTDDPASWPPALSDAVEQLARYFRGALTTFELPLDLEGATDFQRSVYEGMMAVPHGRLTTYGQLAERVGGARMARAVGQAVGSNPIPIIIPCHRVVAADGRLGGFSGGLPVKVALLGVERVAVDGTRDSSRVHPAVIPLDL